MVVRLVPGDGRARGRPAGPDRDKRTSSVIRRFPVRGECPWTPGETVRRKIPRVNGLPQVVVVHVRTQRLRTVTHKDALNEGFTGNRARQAFQLDWVRRHNPWARRHRTASDAEIMQLWARHHANREVWVVTLELTRTEPELFLAAQRPVSGWTAGGNGQYAAFASIDRLPVAAVSEDDVREARAAGARARGERLQAQQAEAARVRAERGRLQRKRYAD